MVQGLKSALVFGAVTFVISTSSFATPPMATRQVISAVDDTRTLSLVGDQAGALGMAQDRGEIESSTIFPHIMLNLRRPAILQRMLDALVAQQQVRGSPDYHRWLTVSQLRTYGPAQNDIDKVTAWLQSRGLAVNAVSPTGMSIDIGGSAAQLGAAFQTPLHSYALRGETHLANSRLPTIPAALAPVIAGVTLSNFFPRPNAVPTKPLFTVPTGAGNSPFYAVVPEDFATIYNVLPLLSGNNGFNERITGAAVTIAVVEETNIHEADWARFRDYFGLSQYSGLFLTLHPGKCDNPGYTGDEIEAAIDAEWAGAAAPNANIVEASCASTGLTFGVETALQNLVEGTGTDATIYSISYGGCEQENGLSFLSGWSNLAEEAAAEGITIVISSGDSGSSCDRGQIDNNGLGVNGLASNPYVTSVGGTDFYDTALGENTEYWTKKNEYGGLGSAKSYVPEIPWDNSCANSILAKTFGETTGIVYCNEAESGPVQNGVGGTGGASLYYPKPSWQSTSVLGVPRDGVRDQPDVAFFAANGIWQHAYLICMSDENEGGAPCIYKGISSDGTPNALFQAYGGTSVAAPAFAGILALETQVFGAKLGNVAPRLYQLAQAQFSNPVLIKSCDSTRGNRISEGCVFNNVTAGDNAEPCTPGSPNCYTQGITDPNVGVLGVPAGKAVVDAFRARPGYSLATGLGSVNAANLLYNY